MKDINMNDVKECSAFATVCSYLELFGEELDINFNFPQILNFLVRFGQSSAVDNNSQADDSKEDMDKSLLEDEDEKPTNHVSHNHRRGSVSNNMALPPVSPSSKPWVMLHIKLLNKLKHRSTTERWENGLFRFLCHYSSEDSYELKNHGYAHLNPVTRTRILKYLLEAQFDEHAKFKEKVNGMDMMRLRMSPLGNDVRGCAYWLFVDGDLNLLLYRQDPEEDDRMQVLAETVDALRELLKELQELAEKPLPEVWKELEISFSVAREKFASLICPSEGLYVSSPTILPNGVIKQEPSEHNSSPTKSSTTSANIQNKNNSHNKTVNDSLTSVDSSDTSTKKRSTNGKEESVVCKSKKVKEDSDEEDLPLSKLRKDVSSSNEVQEEYENVTSSRKMEVEEKSDDEDNGKQMNVRRSGRQRKPVAHFEFNEAMLKKSNNSQNAKKCAAINEDVNGFHQVEDNDATSPKKSHKRKKKHSEKSDVEKKRRKVMRKDDESKDDELKKKVKGRPRKIPESKPMEVENNETPKIKKGRRKRTGPNPWDCDSTEEEHDPEAEDEYFQNFFDPESSTDVSICKSDKWNDKPESDFELPPSDWDPEKDEEYDPKVRGRNYARQRRRRSNDVRETSDKEEDTTSCQVCGGTKMPEWILLCDECDSGYHTLCLRPALLSIPQGDWFCPSCQHKKLVKRLEDKINELADNISRGLAQKRMQARLNFVNISINNIIITSGRKREIADETRGFYRETSYSVSSSCNDGSVHSSSERSRKHFSRKDSRRPRRAAARACKFSFAGESGSTDSRSRASNSASSSSSDERPAVRQTRARREVNYRFDDYDEAIKEAIGEVDEIKMPDIPRDDVVNDKENENGVKVNGTNGPSKESEDEGQVQDEDEDQEDDDLGAASKTWSKVAARAKKKKVTDSDIEALNDKDDSDFRPDEEDGDEEDDAGSFVNDDNSDDSDMARRRTSSRHHRRTAKSSRSHKKSRHSQHSSRSHRRRRHSSQGTEESDPDWNASSARRKRRAAMKPVRYRVSSSSCEEDEVKTRKAQVFRQFAASDSGEDAAKQSKSNRRRNGSDDNEYAPSGSEDDLVKKIPPKSGVAQPGSTSEENDSDEHDSKRISSRMKKKQELQKLLVEKSKKRGTLEKLKVNNRSRNIILSEDESDPNGDNKQNDVAYPAPSTVRSLLRDESDESDNGSGQVVAQLSSNRLAAIKAATCTDLEIPQEAQLSIVEALDPAEFEDALDDLSQLDENDTL